MANWARSSGRHRRERRSRISRATHLRCAASSRPPELCSTALTRTARHQQRPARVRVRRRPRLNCSLHQLRARTCTHAADQLRAVRDATAAAVDELLVNLAGDDRRIHLRSRVRAAARDDARRADRDGRDHGRGAGLCAACALALRQCYGGTELAIGPSAIPGCWARRSLPMATRTRSTSSIRRFSLGSGSTRLIRW